MIVKPLSRNTYPGGTITLLIFFILLSAFTSRADSHTASGPSRPDVSYLYTSFKADTGVLSAGEFIKLLEEQASKTGARPFFEGDPLKDLLTAKFQDRQNITTHFSEFINLTEKKGIAGIDEEKSIFTKLDFEASYPGGPWAYARFLNSTFRYPDKAQKLEIQGTVVVQFLVDRNGNLSDVEVISGPASGGLREEAVRIIKASGKWLPGIQNGRIVASYKKHPMIFRLDTQ